MPLACVPASAQHGGHGAATDTAAPMRVHTEALGSFTRPARSDVPEVQAFFDQGWQLKYAFATDQAARSFREAC